MKNLQRNMHGPSLDMCSRSVSCLSGGNPEIAPACSWDVLTLLHFYHSHFRDQPLSASSGMMDDIRNPCSAFVKSDWIILLLTNSSCSIKFVLRSDACSKDPSLKTDSSCMVLSQA
ncbi:hypothetical protein OPV22_028017 [Ensete ventricosum]|uniref:Uncharacterized protein n=1 Tax=Ensete ventricosum TaxID=4639 RepID=A0AAV8PTI9_ENSVE|nr:hypothetical protein OPV22_028017 [Ensete ventricosum]